MKIKLLAIAGALVLALGFSLVAGAGSTVDSDGDQVPDTFDNCLTTANGPDDGTNQTDGDGDSYGDACDCDYNEPAPGDGFVLGTDLLELFGVFNTAEVVNGIHDNTGDGFILGEDLLYCFSQFNKAVGGDAP